MESGPKVMTVQQDMRFRVDFPLLGRFFYVSPPLRSLTHPDSGRTPSDRLRFILQGFSEM